MPKEKSFKQKAKDKFNLWQFNAEFKWDMFKQDKRFFGMYLLEFILVMILVIGLIVYFDPAFNLVPEPWNFIGLIFLIGALALIQKFSYHFTAFLLGIIALIFSVMLFFNKEIDLISYPYNIFAFFFLAGVVFFLYHYTEGFRNEWETFKEMQKEKH
jgi:uncharacterized membrane protein HdeD (DUF308 family)